MPSSPFQQPSARQHALSRQILEAQDRGDARRLSLLQGQWVHRFGFATLPVSSGLAPVSESPTPTVTALSSESDAPAAAGFSEAARFLEIISRTSEEQPVFEEQPVLEEQPVVEQQPVVKDQSAEPQRPVPAPPLSTPRSLRRWLPAAESSFPKAS